MLSRREFVASPLLLTLPEPCWTPDWDRALLLKSVEAGNGRFDPAEQMVTMSRGPEYQYHTNVRSAVVHPTRDSIEYAQLLLAAGGDANERRARAILERVLPLQDINPASKWYGIWGWYMEEPPSKMSPADWNWADFNGAMLLMIEGHHGMALGEPLRARVLEAIRHAAYSVQRRNVSMTYTNIAVKGTFVTLAAAERLNDRALREYAQDRLMRLCRTLDESGSFAEYNSPTYVRVSITNLTRMRMLLKDEAVLARAARIHDRAWLHLARHWDTARNQLAGPHARAYSTSIGKPVWIEKALRGRLGLVDRGTLAADGEAAVHDLLCPEPVAHRFLTVPEPHLHREIFLPGPDGVRPVQGSTWFEKSFSLGSVNRGDFWVQRRPLLAYWGSGDWIAMRFYKDDYDFASALLYTVQDRGRVLGAITFRSPGGDKHPSLDMVQDGEFMASRLFARLEITGVRPDMIFVHDPRRAAVDLGPVQLWVAFRNLTMGGYRPRLSVTQEANKAFIDLDLLPPEGGPHRVSWANLKQASLAFTLALEAGARLKEMDQRLTAAEFAETHQDGLVKLRWQDMELTASDHVAPVADQDKCFAERIHGAAAPTVRLSDELLAGA